MAKRYIKNEDRNSSKQIISNELDPDGVFDEYRRYLLKMGSTRFDKESYDRILDGTSDTFVFQEGEIPDTTPQVISETGFVDKHLFVDSKIQASMDLSDSGKVLKIKDDASKLGQVENVLYDNLKGNVGLPWNDKENVLHWSNHDTDTGETVYYQPPLKVGTVLYSDKAMTEEIIPFYETSYYAIYEHRDDWKLKKESSEGGLREVYKQFPYHLVHFMNEYGLHTGDGIWTEWNHPAGANSDFNECKRIYSGLIGKWEGAFVKVRKSDAKVISLHHQGYGSQGWGFKGRKYHADPWGEIPDFDTTFA